LTAQLVISETQHPDAQFRQKLLLTLIPGSLVRETVSAAVEFHGQLRPRAIENEDGDAAWILPTKLELGETAVTQ
jgi:hypothetical protein